MKYTTAWWKATTWHTIVVTELLPSREILKIAFLLQKWRYILVLSESKRITYVMKHWLLCHKFRTDLYICLPRYVSAADATHGLRQPLRVSLWPAAEDAITRMMMMMNSYTISESRRVHSRWTTHILNYTSLLHGNRISWRRTQIHINQPVIVEYIDFISNSEKLTMRWSTPATKTYNYPYGQLHNQLNDDQGVRCPAWCRRVKQRAFELK